MQAISLPAPIRPSRTTMTPLHLLPPLRSPPPRTPGPIRTPSPSTGQIPQMSLALQGHTTNWALLPHPIPMGPTPRISPSPYLPLPREVRRSMSGSRMGLGIRITITEVPPTFTMMPLHLLPPLASLPPPAPGLMSTPSPSTGRTPPMTQELQGHTTNSDLPPPPTQTAPTPPTSPLR